MQGDIAEPKAFEKKTVVEEPASLILAGLASKTTMTHCPM